MSEDPDTPKRTVFIRRDDAPPPEAPVMPRQAAVTMPPVVNTTRFGAVGSLVGATLNDNYEVTRYIAQGGMGEIYEGRQIRGNVKVAIKVILPQFAADPEFYKLLEREADLLATLGHDAIVKFRGLSHDPRSQLDYLTLEYVQGPSLEDQMDVGPIDPQSCRSLLRRLASGLDAAHDKGVYHRDLSPDNILLRDGLIERATIIDFGIAKDADASKKTVIGAGFGGKLGFAAPEAFGLFGREIGPWTDIYSLALVVAAAARGKAIDMGTATPIDAIQARQTVPSLDGVEPWLAAVLARMLVPDPAARLRSMAEVIAAVDSLPPIGTAFDESAAATMAKAQFGRQRETTAPPGFANTIPPFSGLEPRRGTTDINFVRADSPKVTTAEAPPKSKLPMMIGGGVALAAVAGIAIMFSGKKAPEAPSAIPAPTTTESVVTAPAVAPAPAAALDWAAARATLAAIPCSDVRAAPPAPGVTTLAASGWIAAGTTVPATAGGYRLDSSAVNAISPAPAAETCAIIGRLRKAAGDSGVQGILRFSGPTNWKISQLERNGDRVKVPLGVGKLSKEIFIVAVADGQGRVLSAPLPSGLSALPYAPTPQRALQFFVSAPQTPEKGSETGNGTAVGRACALGCETASGWVIIDQ